ncbi:DUF5709 domain-containing protein [Yinghuangia sp. YIM S09857]|uniref:DUF5709 domain-containing protein n=1 Tax=Yinghuangia sp. YIM S09857 TaxID=3436929 RepID=UPI003F532EA7
MSSSGRSRGGHGPDDEPYEDPTLDASESLVTDDLSADPLDVGVEPPDRWSAAERFGTTADEAERGESLDQLLDEEEPELEPEDIDDDVDDRWADGPEPRSGRLVDDDEGMFADDVGVDSGAASAEEAAVHILRERAPDIDGQLGLDFDADADADADADENADEGNTGKGTGGDADSDDS